MPRSRPRRRSTTPVSCVAEALEVERADEPEERRRPDAASPWLRSSARREPARPSRVATAHAELPQDRPLDRRRAPGLDQLPAHRSERGVGDRGEPERSVAGKRSRRRPEQRVAGEAPVELGRVVVEREHEPGGVEALARSAPNDDPPVGSLPGIAVEPSPGARRARYRRGSSGGAGTGRTD